MGRDLILVTGASSDIGMALLRALLADTDCRIAAHGFHGMDTLTQLAEEFAGRVMPLHADLSDVTGTAALIEQVLAHGVPSGIVHLPALKMNYERFTKLNWRSFEADMSIQLHSAMSMMQQLLPGMAKLPRARVVFMLSSVVDGIPPKFMARYTIVKYAQLGLMRALAAEYAGTPVRVNAVSPSLVEMPFLADLDELRVKGLAASNPPGRNAKREDIVGAIQFLLSPVADYISGVALPIAAGII